MTFNDFVKEYVRTPHGFALNTIKVYHTFSKHLDAFNPKIHFKELNEELLFAFKSHLQLKAKLREGRPRSTSTSLRRYARRL
ncbi:MAG: phage integrase SAM-like domain-containing protein [Imperialibacter sp.]